MNTQHLEHFGETVGGIAAIVGGLCIIAAMIAVAILYLLTLYRALERCSPANRTLPPGQVWLSLIPCFNLVWQFFVVIHLADSLEREFRQRNLPIEPQPGKSLGLAMCILNIISSIPYLGLLTVLPGRICWIIYWAKIAGLSRQIALPPAATVPPLPS